MSALVGRTFVLRESVARRMSYVPGLSAGAVGTILRVSQWPDGKGPVEILAQFPGLVPVWLPWPDGGKVVERRYRQGRRASDLSNGSVALIQEIERLSEKLEDRLGDLQDRLSATESLLKLIRHECLSGEPSTLRDRLRAILDAI